MAQTNAKTAAAQAKAKQAEAAKAAEETAEKGDFVLISSTNGQPRRRAGMGFTPEGVKVDAGALTPQQREDIIDDPFLKIEELKGEGE